MKTQKKGNKNIMVPSKGKNSSRNWLSYFIPLSLIILVAGIYAPPHKDFFALDDPTYIIYNNSIKSFSFENLKEIFTKTVNGNYHPLTMLSLSLDYHFYKLNPKGYHTTSIIIHMLSTLLVFFLLYRLSGKQWVAGLTALLFGIHPMHVESVAWVSERKDQLYVLFYLASLISYAEYLKKYKAKFLWITAAFFLFSLFSKGQAVTLPLALVLIDFLKGRKADRKAVLEKIPFFILSLIFGMIAYYSQKNMGAVIWERVTDLSFPERLMLSCYSLINYLYKLLLPINLSVMHPYPEKTDGMFPVLVYLSPFILAGLISLLYIKLRKNKEVIFGAAFFLINIALLIQLIPVGGAIVSERYSYLSYIGLFYLLSLFIYYLWNSTINKTIVGISTGIYLFLIAQSGYSRNRLWGSNKALWLNVTEQYPRLSYSYLKLGIIYYRECNEGANQTKCDSAFYYLSNAISLGWKSLDEYGFRGDINLWRNNLDSAIKDYNTSLNYGEDGTVYLHRGMAYGRLSKNFASPYLDSALSDYKHVLKLYPDQSLLYVYIGDTYSKKGESDLAVSNYRQALTMDLDPSIRSKVEEAIFRITHK